MERYVVEVVVTHNPDLAGRGGRMERYVVEEKSCPA